MNLTPYQRWQERTRDGQRMSGGWSVAGHEPPQIAQYEVRGCPQWGVLTWAFGQWWRQGDDGQWKGYGAARYSWRGPYCGACSVNWGSVIVQSADGGNAEAKGLIEAYKANRNTDLGPPLVGRLAKT